MENLLKAVSLEKHDQKRIRKNTLNQIADQSSHPKLPSVHINTPFIMAQISTLNLPDKHKRDADTVSEGHSIPQNLSGDDDP